MYFEATRLHFLKMFLTMENTKWKTSNKTNIANDYDYHSRIQHHQVLLIKHETILFDYLISHLSSI